ncbi:MAG: ComEC/Rec2 family competence protein, partial [Lachnospiraceae bacterium]|nr:ComEC/Rec2 family competence protein [Lachnospiraceae bacterium]
SCSFLLSYAAVMGVGLVHPVLQECILGDDKQRRRRKRRMHRMERECSSAGWQGVFRWKLITVREAVLQTLLMSVAIQITTLPVMLSFYYEIPTYGILLNILVLPLASLLIILAAAASLMGLFLPLAAKFLFGTVSLILSFYDILCSVFLKLPMPITLLGRPSPGRLAGYVLCAAVAVWVWQTVHARRIPLYLWAAGTIFLVLPPFVPALSMTFLDVGQGDGIVIHTPDDVTILIDGGSTSVKQVGEYRIKPFLKYHGIGQIDYMIMSHADEDHISGQKELLENQGKPGEIQIRNLLLPEPAEAYQQEEGYRQMVQLAQSAGVPVHYIHSGDRLTIQDLDVLCLHPGTGFDGGSANAYSTSLSISWQGLHFLLCGDLEKTGEDAVIRQLQIPSAEADPVHIHPKDIPDHYDVLKVSHHGSKNSSSNTFLQQVSPSLAIISCGRDNRYGHPHEELLGRLEQVNSCVLRTDTQGAIKLIFSIDLLP